MGGCSGRVGGCIVCYWRGICRLHQTQSPRLHHLQGHASGQRIGFSIVINVSVQPIHHIEMGVGKQAFQGGVLDLGVHSLSDKRPKVRRRRQSQSFFQAGRGFGVCRLPWGRPWVGRQLGVCNCLCGLLRHASSKGGCSRHRWAGRRRLGLFACELLLPRPASQESFVVIAHEAVEPFAAAVGFIVGREV